MRIIIFGAGGQAKETIDLIEENIKGTIVGFINNNPGINKILGYQNLGRDEDLGKIINKHKATHFFVAIGDLAVRSRLYPLAKEKLKPLTIISKNAVVSRHSEIGEHVIIYPGVVINADVSIGNNVIVNTNASISHEVKIGNHVNINPGANIAGKVKIGELCTISIGASIREKINIAKGSFIGAGAVVVKNTEPGKTYVGIPAEIMQKDERD